MPGTDRRWLWLAWIATLTAVDLGTKSRVFARLGYEHRTSDWQVEAPFLWGVVRCQFRTSFNRGALFGVGQGLTWLYAGAAVVVCLGIVGWLLTRRAGRPRGERWLAAGLSMIAAGSLGNLHDRLGLHGCRDESGRRIHAVRDFIDCTIPLVECRSPFDWRLVPEYDWPIFNLADVWLVVGVAVCLWSWPRGESGTPGQAEETTASPRAHSN